MLPDIHRHPDGSLDLDFYRRRAARQQRIARRALVRATLRRMFETARTIRILLVKRFADPRAAPPVLPFSAKPMSR